MLIYIVYNCWRDQCITEKTIEKAFVSKEKAEEFFQEQVTLSMHRQWFEVDPIPVEVIL